MELFSQFLLASLISGGMLFIAVFMVIKKMTDSELRRRNVELLIAGRQITLPLRLQAYERLVLMLERIALPSLVLRMHQEVMPNRDFHAQLVASLRAEYEHNLAQQLYVSPEVWGEITLAKNAVLNHINATAQGIEPENSSLQLAQLLLQDQGQDTASLLVAKAILRLKTEAKSITN